MASKKPHEMSNEALLKNEKLLKVAIYTMGTLNLLLLVIGTLLVIRKGTAFITLIVIPGGMVPILMININSLKSACIPRYGIEHQLSYFCPKIDSIAIGG